MLENSVSLDVAMEKTGIKPVQVDESTLRVVVVKVIADNPKIVADYKGGKKQAAQGLIGQVMKANKGVPNDIVRRLIEEELAKV